MDLLRPETTEDALPAAPVSSPVAPQNFPSPSVPAPQPIQAPAPIKNEAPAVFGNEPIIQTPTPTQQSWGTVLAIVIIVAMVVIGAFYAWGKRIAQNQQYAPLQAQ